MNTGTTEDRLRAALAARAEQVTQDSLSTPAIPVPQPGRRSHLRLLSVAMPLTAAAALAILVVTTAVRPAIRDSLRDTSSTPSASTSTLASTTPPTTPPASEQGSGTAGLGDPGDGAASTAEVDIDLPAYPALRPGDRVPAVKVLQQLLIRLGYRPGPVDGYYGERTATAATQFLSLRGMPSAGGFGPEAWAALLSAGRRPELRRGSSGEAVQRIQRALTAVLERPVIIDGSFGPQTEAAVREYQQRKGLEASGVVTLPTWQYLNGKAVQVPDPDVPPEPTASADPEPPWKTRSNGF